MLKGVNMSLMIGPMVPVPVSSKVLEALVSVRVTTATEGPSVFQLVFELSTRSDLHTLFVISGGAALPMIRVVIAMTINGSPEVIMDGVMTHHEISPGSAPSTSVLTVTGEDLTRVMDYIDFSGLPFPAMPPSARVALILAKYAFLGVIPKVIPSVLIDIPNPLDIIPRQKCKDLPYIKELADQVGYVFYLDPGPTPGMSFAYWGPLIKVGEAQPALNIDMDAHTNVNALTFNYNSENKELPVVYIQNPETKVPIPIPIPDITPLNPPLGIVPALPKNIRPITETAKYSPLRGVMIGMAKAAQSADCVTAKGSLNVQRYGRLLKPRKLVGVRGAGTAFNGLYYVDSITHNITRGEYTQDFSLSRNGLISTVQQVNP